MTAGTSLCSQDNPVIVPWWSYLKPLSSISLLLPSDLGPPSWRPKFLLCSEKKPDFIPTNKRGTMHSITCHPCLPLQREELSLYLLKTNPSSVLWTHLLLGCLTLLSNVLWANKHILGEPTLKKKKKSFQTPYLLPAPHPALFFTAKIPKLSNDVPLCSQPHFTFQSTSIHLLSLLVQRKHSQENK